jgi:hypothetical protein
VARTNEIAFDLLFAELSSIGCEVCRKTAPTKTALFSCYTESVAKNVTIRISDEAAHWARRQAAEQNSSLSRLVGEMLERQMRLTDEYWRAFDHWKSHRPLARNGAAERLSREELHERR